MSLGWGLAVGERCYVIWGLGKVSDTKWPLGLHLFFFWGPLWRVLILPGWILKFSNNYEKSSCHPVEMAMSKVTIYSKSLVASQK